ncbi:DUF2919 family protein [Enterobacter roggenkampii]|uniref:DUF2919 family protein n=1 Tax=Enterobacter roggenkampii TaxID=1812935 RepID=UPI003CC915D5
MKSTEIHPADYDAQGRIRLPFLFWCVLLLQARTWVLFVMAAASRRQGRDAADALLSRSRCLLARLAARRTGGGGFLVQRSAARNPACGARFAGC